MENQAGLRILELKVPPLALVIIIAAAMWLVATYVPAFHFHFPFQSIIASALGLLGIVACVLGLVAFRRAKTTVNPTKPQSSSSLVTTGIYRYTRNPMYLGFLLMLAGWATATASIFSFLGLPTFVFYMNRFQIEPEERALTSIFGEEFKIYCATVGRWIR